ncbi:MAG: hypothetical protein ACE5EO_08285 [Candidatus Krumholzibacteriia bacterium]
MTGGIFGLVAAAHLARLINRWPVQVAGYDIPEWISWLGLGLAGSLSVWAFRQTRR